MLTFTSSEEKHSSAFQLLGTAKSAHSTNLISDNTSLISNNISLLSSSDNMMDTCSFYNGPSDATIFAFGEQSESCGSIAYAENSESCGSIAYAGSSESCGSIASSSVSSGGCNYSC